MTSAEVDFVRGLELVPAAVDVSVVKSPTFTFRFLWARDRAFPVCEGSLVIGRFVRSDDDGVASAVCCFGGLTIVIDK